MNDYAGKKVWIVGASSGIGHALAQELHRRGANLILSARNVESLAELNISLDSKHEVIPIDVTNRESFANAFLRITKIDCVVYLAAVYTPGSIHDITEENAALTISTNLESVFTFLNFIIPHYKAQGYGQLALCGSVAGYKGLPGGQPYSATKAAIINLAESLRSEMAAENIDVRLINPGFVKTPLTDKNDFSMPMIITPDAAARAIADGLTGKNFEIHFPKRFTIPMKILALTPYRLYFLLARLIAR